MNIVVGPNETLLELVWYSMAIMTLFIIQIFSVQYVMDLLEDVLNALNDVISLVNIRLGMILIFQSI